MASRYMLDSSAWIEYFAGSESGRKIKDLVENEKPVTCILSLAELSDKFSGESEKFERFLAFMRGVSSIAMITVSSCSASGKIKADRRKIRKKFGLVDALIYLTARENGCVLITKDKDFDGMRDVAMI